MLTSAQKVTLKAAVLADPAANAFYSIGDFDGLTSYLNAPFAPPFTVWKMNVSVREIGDNVVGTELAGLTSLNLTRLQTIILMSTDGVNPSLADRRAFFDDVFSGAGGAATRAKLLILWKRLASRVEKILSTGTGSDAVPAIMGFEGPLTSADLIGL